MNLIERAPSQVLPHTNWLVFFCTETKMLGDGVKRLGSIGSNVMVGRLVAVKVGTGVLVTRGVPVGGVVVGCSVLMIKRSGVFVAGKPNGVTVDSGGLDGTGVADCRNGMEAGSALHPVRSEIIKAINVSLFITPIL